MSLNHSHTFRCGIALVVLILTGCGSGSVGLSDGDSTAHVSSSTTDEAAALDTPASSVASPTTTSTETTSTSTTTLATTTSSDSLATSSTTEVLGSDQMVKLPTRTDAEWVLACVPDPSDSAPVFNAETLKTNRDLLMKPNFESMASTQEMFVSDGDIWARYGSQQWLFSDETSQALYTTQDPDFSWREFNRMNPQWSTRSSESTNWSTNSDPEAFDQAELFTLYNGFTVGARTVLKDFVEPEFVEQLDADRRSWCADAGGATPGATTSGAIHFVTNETGHVIEMLLLSNQFVKGSTSDVQFAVCLEHTLSVNNDTELPGLGSHEPPFWSTDLDYLPSCRALLLD